MSIIELKKLCQKPLAARLYGVLNYETAISDTLDRTYVLERVYGVCVGKGRFDGTLRKLSPLLGITAFPGYTPSTITTEFPVLW